MDWPSFLSSNGIPFVEKGRNVSRGNVAINCPFCAGADPSEHCNISLSGKGFYCLRNKQHSGGEARLVQVLLHCTYEQALDYVKGGRSIPDDWYSRVMSLVNASPALAVAQPLKWPKEFRRLDQHRISCRPYWQYLKRERRYTDAQIDRMWDRFDIAYCTKGPDHGRIIFPIYFEERLVTWTGRTISGNQNLRYKTLTADEEKAREDGTQCALGPISNYLLWWDHIIDCDAETIVLCEGPFDALRLMHLGWGIGVVATCFFTAQPGPMQIDLLHELLPRFKRRYLMLDAGTWATGVTIAGSLAALNVERLDLPSGTKDPDLLTVGGFERLIHTSPAF